MTARQYQCEFEPPPPRLRLRSGLITVSVNQGSTNTFDAFDIRRSCSSGYVVRA